MRSADVKEKIYSLPSPGKRRIVILTSDTGFGHRSAANAVAGALSELYGNLCTIDIVNPLEDRRAPFFLRDTQSADYDKALRRIPELYRFGYNTSDNTVPAVMMEQALIVLLFEVIRDIVRTYRPDAILSTYPLYAAPLRAVMTVSRSIIPVMVAVTDLATVHRIWFNTGADMVFVPTDIVRDLALESGLSPDQVKVTGIPVSPKIVRDQRSPYEIRTKLGIDPDLTTIVAVGSRRVDRLVESLNVLNHFGYPLQLIVACGKDAALYEELRQVQWHVPVKLYEYYANIPELMKAADLVMCKAGGLIVTESLACGKPMLLVSVIPGQETGNADYVVSNGAGDLALTETEVLETSAHLMMDDHQLLNFRTEAARRLGRPDAAYDIARAVWQAAQRSALDRRRGTGRLRLIDLLSRNQVHWEED